MRVLKLLISLYSHTYFIRDIAILHDNYNKALKNTKKMAKHKHPSRNEEPNAACTKYFGRNNYPSSE
jgi:hypothetical protein